MVDRRTFLRRGGALATAIAGGRFSAAGAQARDTRVFTFTVSGISPPDNPTSVLFKRYLDGLAQASNGRLKFEWHPGGVLVPANQALDALGQGSIDMLLSQPSYYSGKVSIGSFMELPFFGLSYKGQAELFHNTAAQKLIDEVYREKTNTTVLQLRPFNPYAFIMHRAKTARTLADLNGKKIRTPGGMIDESLKAIGAIPVKLVPGEFYQALQQGIVDGLLLPVYTLESYRLGELKPTVTQPAPGALIAQLVWMNLNRWNQLPGDLQALIRSTSLAEIPRMDDFWRAEDEKSLAYARKTGVDVIQLSKADQQLMTQRASSVIETFQKREGDRGRQLVKLFQA